MSACGCCDWAFRETSACPIILAVTHEVLQIHLKLLVDVFYLTIGLQMTSSQYCKLDTKSLIYLALNYIMNWWPQSDRTSLGSPGYFQTSLRYNLVVPFVLRVV
jgi:hypothetical protein